ncbi:MAG: hypothetical protein ACJ8C4_20905 [Gemmataceae bacterium]
MAQYYTLDEASRKLGISGEEFRKRLATEWKTLRRFPDGNTLRFQSREIDELARTLGRSSEPDLPAGEAPLKLAEEAGPAVGSSAEQQIYVPPSSDDFVPLSLNDGGPKSTKPGSDSDVKLEKSGDSARAQSNDDATEEMDLPKPKETFEIKGESAPKPKTKVDSASEFDLTLESESDEFDLQLSDDDSEEIDLARGRKGKRAGDSGINLQDPADSGISLEKDSSEFELQLESDTPGKKPPSSGRLHKPPSSKKLPPQKPPSSKKLPKQAAPDSDSEFELTLDEGSDPAATAFDSGEQKDIFETDFELPGLEDSGTGANTDSELDSDFELNADDSGDESASEVVAIEEEDVEDDLQPLDEEPAELEPVAAVEVAPSKPAEWGALPAVVMSFSVLVMFFVGVMGYELLHSMWGYHTNGKASGVVINTVAGMIGELPKD